MNPSYFVHSSGVLAIEEPVVNASGQIEYVNNLTIVRDLEKYTSLFEGRTPEGETLTYTNNINYTDVYASYPDLPVAEGWKQISESEYRDFKRESDSSAAIAVADAEKARTNALAADAARAKALATKLKITVDDLRFLKTAEF